MQSARGKFDGSICGTLWRNRYLGCAMAIHRRILPGALPIPVGAPMHDMWLGLAGRLSGAVIYLPTPYLRYRRHGGNTTSSRRQPIWRMARWRVALALALARRWPAIARNRRSSTDSRA